ncbi:hypothetical protein [Longimicrobium sp.]|uniref:hypothetical protein n=1 Tax=Longimicrobium sp. TaxID=2029185 RepID=UPI002C1571E9|nr:hypothetical protein [Longimicrobium sp.]HSU15484.1 hypothetical protein [Longimicrobium sp.]
MAKTDDLGRTEKGGYRPLNEGYAPKDRRTHVPHGHRTTLPKAPAGGTGQTSPAKSAKNAG